MTDSLALRTAPPGALPEFGYRRLVSHRENGGHEAVRVLQFDVRARQRASGAHRVRVGDVEVDVANPADVIRVQGISGRPKDLQVLPLLYRHLHRPRP